VVRSIESSDLLFKCAMQDNQLIWEQKKTKILEQLSPEEGKSLLAHSIRYTQDRGEIFYPSESDVPRIYIMDRGYIRFCRITEDGGRVITGFLGPADIFGSIFAPTKASNEADFIEVVREARLIGIETEAFKRVLQQHPNFMMRLLEILETRQQQLEHRVLSLVTKDVYAQTAEILIELSEKFGENCLEEPDLSRHIALTHQEIADLVGVARPTVSKIISELLKGGLLRKHNHHLCLNNKARLQSIADYGQKGL
jgi:CRP/FNR family cyclic AMP-dependent transcriptional regulator